LLFNLFKILWIRSKY